MMNIIKWQEETTSTSKTLGRTSATSSTSTLTTSIMHSKGATITIKYNYDNTMDIDWRHLRHRRHQPVSIHIADIRWTNSNLATSVEDKTQKVHFDLYIRVWACIFGHLFAWKGTSERGCETSWRKIPLQQGTSDIMFGSRKKQCYLRAHSGPCIETSTTTIITTMKDDIRRRKTDTCTTTCIPLSYMCSDFLAHLFSHGSPEPEMEKRRKIKMSLANTTITKEERTNE